MNDKNKLYVRKDALPEDTIKTITNILRDNDIDIKTTEERGHNGYWYSTRIEIKGFNHVGTNGKGITPKYSMASALGEFMERLQTQQLLSGYYPNFNKDIENDTAKLDSVLEIYKNYFSKYFFMRSNDELLEILKENHGLCELKRYYSIGDNKIIDLPEYFIRYLCGSNGTSAGNSKEEAISQGLCELLERYTLKKIHCDSTYYGKIPSVSRQVLKSTRAYELLLEIERKGYIFEVKDCTLGGKIPVCLLIPCDHYYLHNDYIKVINCMSKFHTESHEVILIDLDFEENTAYIIDKFYSFAGKVGIDNLKNAMMPDYRINCICMKLKEDVSLQKNDSKGFQYYFCRNVEQLDKREELINGTLYKRNIHALESFINDFEDNINKLIELKGKYAPQFLSKLIAGTVMQKISYYNLINYFKSEFSETNRHKLVSLVKESSTIWSKIDIYNDKTYLSGKSLKNNIDKYRTILDRLYCVEFEVIKLLNEEKLGIINSSIISSSIK